MATINEPIEAAVETGDKPKKAYLPLTMKIELCLKAERQVWAEKSLSLKAFCRQHNIQPSQLRR
eukprot:scaffold4274_cov175-Amphora_coffeaeformis.AAC.16